MKNIYSNIFNYLQSLDPEKVHHFVSNKMSLFPEMGKIQSIFSDDSSDQMQQVLTHSQLSIKNPLMLAAGFDKDGKNVDYFNQLGIGGMEIGTVTKCPQLGNPAPRIKRIVKEKALFNSMGFPSVGMNQCKLNIQNQNYKYSDNFLLGINIGKNKETDIQLASQEYSDLINHFKDIAKYFTVNISSPNTKGLRDIFKLENFPSFIQEIRSNKPIFLKISPDLENEHFLKIIKITLKNNSDIKGFILSNTSSKYGQFGGYSGPKLYPQLIDKVKLLNKEYNGNYPFDLIACGGLSNYQQILELMYLNISVFQFYTGFIYGGPLFFNKLNNSLYNIMKSHKYQSFSTFVKDKDFISYCLKQ